MCASFHTPLGFSGPILGDKSSGQISPTRAECSSLTSAVEATVIDSSEGEWSSSSWEERNGTAPSDMGQSRSAFAAPLVNNNNSAITRAATSATMMYLLHRLSRPVL